MSRLQWHLWEVMSESWEWVGLGRNTFGLCVVGNIVGSRRLRLLIIASGHGNGYALAGMRAESLEWKPAASKHHYIGQTGRKLSVPNIGRLQPST